MVDEKKIIVGHILRWLTKEEMPAWLEQSAQLPEKFRGRRDMFEDRDRIDDIILFRGEVSGCALMRENPSLPRQIHRVPIQLDAFASGVGNALANFFQEEARTCTNFQATACFLPNWRAAQ